MPPLHAHSRTTAAESSPAGGTHSRGGNREASPRKAFSSIRGRRFIAGLVLLTIVVASVFVFTEFEWATVKTTISELDPVLLFLLMVTLPVAGFSIGLVYLVAGVRFGPVLGGVVVAAATSCHLILTHWISRTFLRAPLQRLLARKKQSLLEVSNGDHGAVALMAALVPGPPYFLRNYLLALSSIPLRTYFWICLPVYVARSYVTIFLGDLGSNPSRRSVLILVVVYGVKLTICAYLIRRLQQRRQRREASAVKGKSGE